MVPSRYANRSELIALCEVLSDFDGTSIEFIPALGPFEQWAMDLMADMSVAANSPLNWNVLNINARTLDEGKKKLEAGDIAASKRWKSHCAYCTDDTWLTSKFLGWICA